MSNNPAPDPGSRHFYRPEIPLCKFYPLSAQPAKWQVGNHDKNIAIDVYRDPGKKRWLMGRKRGKEREPAATPTTGFGCRPAFAMHKVTQT